MVGRLRGNQSLFFAPTSKRLARDITISSPSGFRRSIATIKQDGVTLKERRALILAQNRARVQLNRKNLSLKERIEFRAISAMRIPKITK